MNPNELPPLVVLVGYPRAGKSTSVQHFYIPNGYAVVSPDILRSIVHGKPFDKTMEHYIWSVVYLMADSLRRAGCRVVIDGTHISHARRTSWIERGAVFHHIPTPADVCLQRAASQSNGCDIIPVIKKMMLEFEPIDYTKGEIAWEPPTPNVTTNTAA